MEKEREREREREREKIYSWSQACICVRMHSSIHIYPCVLGVGTPDIIQLKR